MRATPPSPWRVVDPPAVALVAAVALLGPGSLLLSGSRGWDAVIAWAAIALGAVGLVLAGASWRFLKKHGPVPPPR